MLITEKSNLDISTLSVLPEVLKIPVTITAGAEDSAVEHLFCFLQQVQALFALGYKPTKEETEIKGQVEEEEQKGRKGKYTP